MTKETKALVVAMLFVIGLFAALHVPAELVIPYVFGLALYVNTGLVDEASRGIMRFSGLLVRLSKWKLNPNLALVMVTSLFVFQTVLYMASFISAVNGDLQQVCLVLFKLLSAIELSIGLGLCIGDCLLILAHLSLRYEMLDWMESQRVQIQAPILAVVGVCLVMTVISASQNAASLYISSPLLVAGFGLFLFLMNASVSPFDVIIHSRNDSKILLLALVGLLIFGFILSSKAAGVFGDALLFLSKVATGFELFIAAAAVLVGMWSYVNSRHHKFPVPSDLSV